jgi:hypothetical protein
MAPTDHYSHVSIGAAFVAALLLFYAVVMLRSSLVGKGGYATAWSPRWRFPETSRCWTPDAVADWRSLLAQKTNHRQGGRHRSMGRQDQSNNNPEATLTNAAAEGVADRVEAKPAISKARFPTRRSTRSSR